MFGNIVTVNVLCRNVLLEKELLSFVGQVCPGYVFVGMMPAAHKDLGDRKRCLELCPLATTRAYHERHLRERILLHLTHETMALLIFFIKRAVEVMPDTDEKFGNRGNQCTDASLHGNP